MGTLVVFGIFAIVFLLLGIAIGITISNSERAG